MKLPHVSRHDWWRALTLASLLLVCSVSRAAERTEIDLSGAGWHLSLDTAAKWRSDTLFFPAPRPDLIDRLRAVWDAAPIEPI